MNTIKRLIALVAILILCSSCSQLFMAKWPPANDPLKGWNSWVEYDEEAHPEISQGGMILQRAQPAKHSPLDKAIKDDYLNYLKKHEPGYFASGSAEFFEDGTGRHAVRIRTGQGGSYTVYIFMYDKQNVRTKIMRFKSGGYAC